MKKILSILIILAFVAGCKPSANPGFTYIFPEGPESGEVPGGEDSSEDITGDESEDPSEGKDESQDPSADPSTDPENRVPCWIWIDAAANSPDFFTGQDNIRRDLEKAADAGFTHIIVDVRPTNGDILFKSTHCDQVAFLGAWTNKGYTKINWDQSYDYLQSFIDIGHELGLKVWAGFNTFVAGGKNTLGNQGIVFRDDDMAKLATVLNSSSGLKTALELSDVNEVFFNPVHEDVQNYLISLLEDLAAYGETGLDGIILDRGRFQGYQSDFSDYTKAKFEDYIGESVSAWPQDVLPVGFKWGDSGGVPSPVPVHYKQWNEFRVKVIHDFMEKASQAVKAVNPKVGFGAYVGGWYASYYENGVNWASPQYNTAGSYPTWATAKYKDYGYADHMDVIVIGAYASPKSVYGSSEWTMQGFCKLAYQKIKGDCMVVGGPDVGNWNTTGVSQKEEYEAVKNSVKACANACDGYFLFDMIHLKQQTQKWKYVKDGIEEVNNQ